VTSGRISVGDKIWVGAVVSVADFVSVGLDVRVGSRVVVARGVFVGGVVCMGDGIKLNAGSSLVVGGAVSMLLHAEEIRTITIIRYSCLPCLFFTSPPQN
jgi:acyl-[acyl carrier protein]--UDP-N-acetylglucosamine O-acyltransferase